MVNWLVNCRCIRYGSASNNSYIFVKVHEKRECNLGCIDKELCTHMRCIVASFTGLMFNKELSLRIME